MFRRNGPGDRGGGKQITQKDKRSNRIVSGGPYGGNNSSGNRRVYVGNLSWDVSWQDLKDHMRSAGNVIRADVLEEDNGRSKGCGLVEYATEDEAIKAVQTLHNTDMKGRLIFVREDREAQKVIGNQRASTGHANRRVYVGNLSWDVSWQDLKDHMRSAGDIARADVMCDSDGRSKGCGLVEYVHSQGAGKAIDTLNDTELKGRLIFVREDREADSGTGSRNQRGPPIGSALGSRSNGGGGSGGGGGGGNSVSLSSMTGNRVYVGNLAWDVSWQDLKDYMRTAGDVVRADVMEDNGRSKGCGIIEFDSPKSAANAITMLNNTSLKGRQIHVREDREELKSRLSGGSIDLGSGAGGPRSAAGRQVYVRNIAFSTSWQALKDHFKPAGDVQRVEIATDENGNSRGFGTVRFGNAQDALYAIDTFNGSVLDDWKIEVRLDQQVN